MKNLFRFKLALALVLANLAVWNAPGALTGTLNAIGNAPATGLTVGGNCLYVTTAVANDDFFSSWGSDGVGDYFPLGPVNTPTGSGAYNPVGPMVVSGTVLYGTGNQGGSDPNGCVFTVNTNGSEFEVLHVFEGGGDGSDPQGGLILSGNLLYGTTAGGNGTVFVLDTSGNITNLWSFSGTDGSSPQGGMVLSGDTLYGTTSGGGSGNDGTVFAVHTDGTGFTNLYHFNGSDGANPQAGLLLSDNILYGTTYAGGSNNLGTIFSIHTDGTGFKTLHLFKGSDGMNPQSPLAMAGGVLYGMTSNSSSLNSIIYSLKTNGLSFTVQNSDSSTRLINGFASQPLKTSTALFAMGQAFGGPVFVVYLASGTSTGPDDLGVITTSLPEGTNGLEYSQTLTAVGGQTPYVWKLAAGSLPKGLTLATNGVLSGKPTIGGTFDISVEVTDAASAVSTQPLTLEIFTPDSTPPTITITSPKTGAKTSNEVFNVTGTAKDNVAVAEVLVLVNGGDWTEATPTNDWATWGYSADLVASTNTISVYAVDTSGNLSTTDTVKLVYIVTATLVVGTNGDGTVSPNDNGKELVLGDNYSMKARAARGFGFEKWTDGSGDLLTSNATLNFDMSPGLDFIAYFVDVTKPKVTITSPKNNAKITGTTVTVTGTAADNVGVTGVWYQLNSGVWTEATGLASWTAANVAVGSGANTIKIYATDAAGNVSVTNKVTFTDTP